MNKVKCDNGKTIALSLSKSELDFLSLVFHEFKDMYRSDKNYLKKAMKIERKMKRVFGYEPDTTYDLKL